MICTFCFNQFNNVHVEDEFHVFFICSKFNSVEENFLFPWYSRGDSKAEFFSLMKVSTPDSVRKICIYVNAILKIKDKEYKL